MKQPLCAVLMSMLLLTPAFGQMVDDQQFDAITKRGIDHVYNLEFEKAENEFAQLVKVRPEHPAGHFFLAMVDWWRILIDLDNEQYDDRFLDSLDNVIDLCDRILDKNENDVMALFFKGGSIGFIGRLKFHRDDYFAAANAGRKALPIVQEASRLDPNNYDILLGSGMYNYYADVIPEQYPFVKPLLLFIPPGDKKKGLEQITQAAEKGKYAGIESTYFLMQLYYFQEKDYAKALTLAASLHSRFPDNAIFHRYLGRCYVSTNNWQSVQQVFTEISALAGKGRRGYSPAAEREAQYYLGLAHMNAARFDSSLAHFYRSDELSRTLDTKEVSGFMVMTNLKMGMIYDMLSKRDLAVSQYKKVLGMRDYQDSHKQAEQLLKIPLAH
jgi:tetratricopeptide (TPR) repeat protein